MHIISLSSYNGYKLNALFRRGFIAQSVEHRTGNSDFFLGFLCNCLSWFTTAKITFTPNLYPQFIYMIYIIGTS